MNSAIQVVVAATLQDAGLLADEASLQRTVLVQKGYYVGLKFRYEGGYAVWLAESNEIKVHAENGTLLKSVCLNTTGTAKAA